MVRHLNFELFLIHKRTYHRKKRKDDSCEDLELYLKDKKSFIMKRN